MRRLVETETGVYQPQSVKWATIPPLLILLVTAILTLMGQISPNFFFIGLATMTLIPTWFERWKYGKLGKPFVSIQAGSLIFTLPSDSRGRQAVPLSTLRELIIYGPDDRRYYRLVHDDGSFVEATPAWSRAMDEAAIRFIQRRLPPTIKVTVKEPQSVFAYIRGDGP